MGRSGHTCHVKDIGQIPEYKTPTSYGTSILNSPGLFRPLVAPCAPSGAFQYLQTVGVPLWVPLWGLLGFWDVCSEASFVCTHTFEQQHFLMPRSIRCVFPVLMLSLQTANKIQCHRIHKNPKTENPKRLKLKNTKAPQPNKPNKQNQQQNKTKSNEPPKATFSGAFDGQGYSQSCFQTIGASVLD